MAARPRAPTPVSGHARRPTTGAPRWVYAVGVSAIVLFLLVGILTHRGMSHGHMPPSGGSERGAQKQ